MWSDKFSAIAVYHARLGNLYWLNQHWCFQITNLFVNVSLWHFAIAFNIDRTQDDRMPTRMLGSGAYSLPEGLVQDFLVGIQCYTPASHVFFSSRTNTLQITNTNSAITNIITHFIRIKCSLLWHKQMKVWVICMNALLLVTQYELETMTTGVTAKEDCGFNPAQQGKLQNFIWCRDLSSKWHSVKKKTSTCQRQNKTKQKNYRTRSFPPQCIIFLSCYSYAL